MPTFSLTVPAGSSVIPIGVSAQEYTNAEVIIDRTVAGGLNSLSTSATLELEMWAQLTGSGAWQDVGGVSGILGGTYVIKGITTTQEGWLDTVQVPFAVGTLFEVRALASDLVNIAGLYLFS